jgi:hypothetical protein
MTTHFTVLQKGYFWQLVGLLIFFGGPIVVELVWHCDPLEDCDSISLWFQLVMPFVTLFGPGLYFVGAAHIAISPAHRAHKLLAIGTPILLIWLLVMSTP